ncbi:uncharacterized protein [Anoplolepis gracilipes]|uniref:uncharacterized protein n=1 Tax=Anoplolepis gracilipes TaxID=354296 RepID=UPI003BA24F75
MMHYIIQRYSYYRSMIARSVDSTDPGITTAWNIQKFSNEAGMYFEKIGKVNQVESAWKMVIKLDITALSHRHQQLQGYMAQTRALCYDKPLEENMKDACDTLQLIEKDNEQVTTLLTRIKTIYQTSEKPRRGLIDGLGTIAKTLFGTMNANDERIIKEQMNLLQGKQQTLQHVMKNQIKVLNATIAHVDHLEKVIQENKDRFLNITEKMRRSWLQMKKNYGYREELDEHFIVLNAIIGDLMNNMMDIITHLQDVKKGIINIRLVPIEEVISNLREIVSQMPQEARFPFQIAQGNWEAIGKFITISAYYDNTHVYKILRFPLV